MFEPTDSMPADGAFQKPTPPPQDTSSPTPSDNNVSAPLWLRRGDQLFVGGLLIAGIVLLLLYWVQLSGWGRIPIGIERSEASRYEFKLDINRATWVEWEQLDGIGEVLARRIVEDRNTNGPFKSVDDLRRVKGIGATTLDRIRPWLTVADPAESPEP